MSYKSPRLLRERVDKEMEELRKQLMSADDQLGQDIRDTDPDDRRFGEHRNRVAFALDQLNTLREFVGELAAMAMRPTLDEVAAMKATDYVAAMMPLVTKYHQQLMVADKLTACLCADLQAEAAIVILIGDGRTVVRTARHPDRPEMDIAVDAVLEKLGSIQQDLEAGAREVEAGFPTVQAMVANDQAADQEAADLATADMKTDAELLNPGVVNPEGT